MEAGLRGIPVIGSFIGGIPEMIENGVNGFLFEPGNARELRSAIDRLRLLNFEELQIQCRKFALTHFRIDDFITRFEDVIKKTTK
jgi:glycosyltransferase involved in cell wall biosynthesis